MTSLEHSALYPAFHPHARSPTFAHPSPRRRASSWATLGLTQPLTTWVGQRRPEDAAQHGPAAEWPAGLSVWPDKHPPSVVGEQQRVVYSGTEDLSGRLE